MRIEQWLAYLLFIAPGALIWFGQYRSWVHSRTQRYPHLAFPWISLALATSAVSKGLGLAEGVVLPAMVALFLIGISAVAFSWPSWAVPRWYREHEASESSGSAGES